MIPSGHEPRAHTPALAERDELSLFQATRGDTGEQIWLVQSRSDPNRYYLLTPDGEAIRCLCPQYLSHGTCAHVAAVSRAFLSNQPEIAPASGPQQSQSSTCLAPQPQRRRGPRTEEERRRREEAEHRDNALLWTDDRPFSLFKS